MANDSDTFTIFFNLHLARTLATSSDDLTFKISLGEKGVDNRAISFLNAALRLKTDGDRIKCIQFLDRSMFSIDSCSIHVDVKMDGLSSTYAGHNFMSRCNIFASPPTSIAGYFVLENIRHWGTPV